MRALDKITLCGTLHAVWDMEGNPTQARLDGWSWANRDAADQVDLMVFFAMLQKHSAGGRIRITVEHVD